MIKSAIKDLKKHRIQYMILFSGLVLDFVGFFAFLGYPFLRIMIILWMGIFYFSWGIVHHWLAKDLHIKIALEYLLIAAIGCGLLLSIILRS